jgi:hypothetical protein
VSEEEELQREVTRAALRALDRTRFALAGAGAIREHGIIDRPTEDIDLFTSDVDAVRFDAAVGRLVDELRTAGNDVDELRRVEQFARLHVTTSTGGPSISTWVWTGAGGAEPVTLSVGPVLSLYDAVGNKVSALYSRAEARDYLDVDSIRASRKFTDAELIASALDRDPGFEVSMFASQLDSAQKLRPERVADYGVEPAQLDAIKGRFGQWAAELLMPTPHEDSPATVQQLDLELQRIVDVNKVNFPTSATEMRRPSASPEARGYPPPSQQSGANEHGLGR